MEADDLGTYVVKFRGAGQGRKALIAEVISAHWPGPAGWRSRTWSPSARPGAGRGEPDQEIQDLLRASAGLNLGVDFLPGALDFDAAAATVSGELAGRIMWFDALVGNADRSWRNPNMLLWHGELYLIDHGATLTFQHRWETAQASVARPYDVTDHALLGCGPLIDDADAELAPRLTAAVLPDAARQVPAEWLAGEPGFGGVDHVRDAYVAQLTARLAARRAGSRPLPPLPGRTSELRPPTAQRRGRVGLAQAGQPLASPRRGRPAMTGRPEPFEYAILRVVPRVDRGEAMNAGVLLYCRPLGYLRALIDLDVDRLLALDPAADVPAIERALAAIVQASEQDPGAGQAGLQDIGRRFGWLTAPRSTVVQPGPVHTGLTSDPAAEASDCWPHWCAVRAESREPLPG